MKLIKKITPAIIIILISISVIMLLAKLKKESNIIYIQTLQLNK